MELTRIIYTSDALPGIELSHLKAILFTAEQFNSKNQITGALAFGQGRFLQVLEGDKSVLQALYSRIERDARNENVHLISLEPISSRTFPNWWMRYVRFDEGLESTHRGIVERLTAGRDFVPREWTAEQCLQVLVALTTERLRS